MKVVVTGGLGYIGRFVIRYLKLAGHEVHCFDNGITNDFRTDASVHFCDVTNPDDLTNAFDLVGDVDAIIHLAAHISVREAEHHPTRYLHNNLVGTAVTARVGALFGVKHFLQASSAAVYNSDMFTIMREGKSEGPVNTYGYSKLMAEEAGRGAMLGTGAGNHVALRLFNVYGSDADAGMGKTRSDATDLPTVLVNAAMEGELLSLTTTVDGGFPERDFIHVRDVAGAFVHYLHQCQTLNAVDLRVNIGTGIGTPIDKFASMFENNCGLSIIVPGFETDKVKRSVADTTAMNLTGFYPKFLDMEANIRDLLQFRP